jgi:hypothetical protein
LTAPSAEPRPKALKAELLLHFLFAKYDVVARILELHAGEGRCRDYVELIKGSSRSANVSPAA